MTLLINKPKRIPSKEDLLFDLKFCDDFQIGESISDIRKRDPRLKFGMYAASDFDELTPADCVFLQLCRSNCDLFIVSIPTSYSLKLNGKNARYETSERIFRLGSLTSIDYIVAYDEENCALSVDKVDPDFIFYGRTKSDKGKYDQILQKEKLTLVEYPWREERVEGNFFQL